MLKKRGPDSFATKTISTTSSYDLIFSSSVLSLRGNIQDQVTTQPLIDAHTDNILLWNGEIFASDLVRVGDDENDGHKLLQELSATSFSQEHLFRVFEAIKGPYAFVFYEKASNSVYFGRDRLGRRSLLLSLNTRYFDQKNPVVTDSAKNIAVLTLSSVKIRNEANANFFNEFEELKANGIYKLNLNHENESRPSLVLFEWKRLNSTVKSTVSPESEEDEVPKVTYMSSLRDVTLIDDSCVSPFNNSTDGEENIDFDALVEKFHTNLRESVMRRVKSIPNNCKACSHMASSSDRAWVMQNI